MRSLLAFLALATPAFADEVTLHNGSTFSGVVREQGDKVTIEMDYGTMTFKRIDVRSVRKGRDPVGDFEEKIRTATSTPDLAAIAAWALDNGLRGRAEGLYRRILTRDPDHAEARRVLGFEKLGGRWRTGDDLQAARGPAKVERPEPEPRSDPPRSEPVVAPEPWNPPAVESEPPPQLYLVPCPPRWMLPPGPPPAPAPIQPLPPQQPSNPYAPPLSITPLPGTPPNSILVRPFRITSNYQR